MGNVQNVGKAATSQKKVWAYSTRVWKKIIRPHFIGIKKSWPRQTDRCLPKLGQTSMTGHPFPKGWSTHINSHKLVNILWPFPNKVWMFPQNALPKVTIRKSTSRKQFKSAPYIAKKTNPKLRHSKDTLMTLLWHMEIYPTLRWINMFLIKQQFRYKAITCEIVNSVSEFVRRKSIKNDKKKWKSKKAMRRSI